MKRRYLILIPVVIILLTLPLLTGCGLRERTAEIDQRITTLEEKVATLEQQVEDLLEKTSEPQ
jgi:hypothetical protein